MPSKKNTTELINIEKNRISEIFPTAGFTNFKKLYIIAGRERNIPEKRDIDKYRINGSWGDI